MDETHVKHVIEAALLAAGLITAGAMLRFTRKRVGASFDATVTDTGRIRLERVASVVSEEVRHGLGGIAHRNALVYTLWL